MTETAAIRDLPIAGAHEPDLAELARDVHDHAPAESARRQPDRRGSFAGVEVTHWLSFDGMLLTPVVDPISRKLLRAGLALSAGESSAAAEELRHAAAELRQGALCAAAPDSAAMRVEVKLAQATSWRLASSAVRMAGLARAIGTGDIASRNQLHAAIDLSCSADLEQRWLVADESVWYPLCGEAPHRFARAALALTRRDYAGASCELAQAAGFLRLEAARAVGNPRRVLQGAAAELGAAGAPAVLAPPAMRRRLERCFATACLALALAHRRWGAEYVRRGAAAKAGYEFHALAQCLYGLTAWVEGSAGTAASAAAEIATGVAEPLLARIPIGQPALTRRIETLGRALQGLGELIERGQAADTTLQPQRGGSSVAGHTQ